MIVKTLVHSATAIVLAVILWPLSVAALEPLAVYEDWSQASIRSDRWRGGQAFGGQEVKRVVTPGHTLMLRYRHEGSTASDTGSTAPDQFLDLTNPTQITEIEATFTVDALIFMPCAANNTGGTPPDFQAATRARPVGISLSRFNDGSSTGPGDRTGDHEGAIRPARDGNTTDPHGVLQVFGSINRYADPAGASFHLVRATPLLGTVNVGDTFTLLLQWDKPNKQFLFSLNGGPTHALPYTASDSHEAAVPFADIFQEHTVANCTAGAAVIDSTARVGAVRTNSSAVIP